jgi:hypothetical protein
VCSGIADPSSVDKARYFYPTEIAENCLHVQGYALPRPSLSPSSAGKHPVEKKAALANTLCMAVAKLKL